MKEMTGEHIVIINNNQMKKLNDIETRLLWTNNDEEWNKLKIKRENHIKYMRNYLYSSWAKINDDECIAYLIMQKLTD